MIRISFENNRMDNNRCSTTDERIQFAINQIPFEHRECRLYEDALLFDGYAIWFKGNGEALKHSKGFSLSFPLAPLG